MPSGDGAPSQRPTSSRFGTVAEHATNRTEDSGVPRRLCFSLRTLSRDTTASSEPPRSSPNRWTSSIMTSAQSPKKDMPPLSLFLRVMLSNFSGVVSSMSTLLSSLHETISVSPVSSLHTTPMAPNAAIHSSFFSCTSALSGAM